MDGGRESLQEEGDRGQLEIVVEDRSDDDDNDLVALSPDGGERERERERGAAEACLICMEETEASGQFGYGCGHLYCRECLREQILVALRHNEVEELKCPQPQCPCRPTREHVATLCAEFLQLYDERLANGRLQRDPRVRWCPDPACGNPVRIDEPSLDGLATCFCGTSFCPNCMRPPHAGQPCEEPSDLLQYLQSGNGTTKNCPLCRNLVEKRSGCNVIKCPLCRKHFCWLCDSDISEVKYGHFSANPDIECHGKLWSGANNLTEMRQREEARREWRAKHPVRYCLTQTCKFLLLAPSILLVAPVVLIMGILVLIFACCYFYCCKGQIPANNPDNPEPIIDAPTDVIIDI